MRRIIAADVPSNALLARFDPEDGHHIDAYFVDLDRSVDLQTYVEAFYQTPLFRCERVILRLAGHPSSDDGARAVALGVDQKFAAWTVLDRSATQLLMADVFGATCSWFKVEPKQNGCRLWFGSALIKPENPAKKQPFYVSALMPFHRLYSRLLLRSAAWKLR